LTNADKRILFLSNAHHGSHHDYKMLKTEFKPEVGVWFDEQQFYVDLGFLGITKDYCDKVNIPNKRSKKKELSLEQKEQNRSVSKIRIKVEHSIGGMKRYRILSDRLRLRNLTRYNQIAGICAGIWNFALFC
jgi:DDE superfamily endonuclease